MLSARFARRWPAVLLYGVVAVLAGSFFTAVAYYADSASSWALEDRRLSGFLLIYGLTLAGGAPAQLVVAGCLWWLTRRLHWNGPVSWAGTGGVLGLAVPWSMAKLGYLIDGFHFSTGLQQVKSALLFPLVGPMMFVVQPAWVRVSAGAATALALWLVARRLRRVVVVGTLDTAGDAGVG